ncbi:uncharacterized protein LOC115441766 [Manduca sexta]|uniref:uncharacterized protein LOC115441766 n=1 Tax=Manduca sexta TaxID=7130 RepID=UPI001183E444|nr:uncharacterized protein LOC115441766 [Manduca sexta]
MRFFQVILFYLLIIHVKCEETTEKNKRGREKAPTEHVDGNKGKDELLHLTKDLMYHEKSCDKEDDVSFAAGGNNEINITRSESDVSESRRSCIFCDNVQIEDCYDPKNKLIPSIMCEREEDLCYSQHTPFGIIDRGCFNVNHNLTTYVCSCNLCNYISISEMPYIFSNKRDWVDNVVELSRTRHFRKSVFKDMTCLRCEVNVTTKRGDMLDSANCLEGNVGALPIQQCEEDEICAVRAIKNTGFMWRGCVKAPLYNYWWALCDTDLCNYDALISIYDFM